MRGRGGTKTLSSMGRTLLNLGVSRQALHTTLELEGRTDLRTVLEEELWMDDHGDSKWIYFYPNAAKTAEQRNANYVMSDLIYSLFLKEAYLLEHAVYVVSLLDMARRVAAGELFASAFIDSVGDKETTMLFVTDFIHDNDITNRFQPNVQEELNSMLTRVWNIHNIPIVIRGTVPPKDVNAGWGISVTSIIQDNARAMQFAVNNK